MTLGHPASDSPSVIQGIIPLMGFSEARSLPPTLGPGHRRVTQALLAGPSGQGLNYTDATDATGRSELEK